jgi:hypothetical protein
MLAKQISLGTTCPSLRSSQKVLRPYSCAPFQRHCISTIRSKSTILTVRAKALPHTRSIRFQVRSESTVAAPPPHSASISNGEQPLTWNRFLQLRKVRRRISLVASIACAMTAFVGGVSYISSTPDIEAKISPVLGLDPLITMGILTFACGAGGWLIGPFIGGAMFSLRYRSMTRMIAEVSS